MKVLVNSYPKSGTTMFTNAINMAIGPLELEGTKQMPLPYGKNWVTWKHENIILMGNFGDDVIICNILRNPIDAISSNVDRWFSGFTGNVIQGVPVHNPKIINRNPELTEENRGFIEHQKDMYMTYLKSLYLNFNNITVFTYEQLKNNPEQCVNNIIALSNEDYSRANHYHTRSLLCKSPSERGTHYQAIRDYLSNNLQEINDLYLEVLDMVKEKQATYPIAMNPWDNINK